VLEDCDQVSLGLGRLHRQGRISEQDWRSSMEHLAQIQAKIEVYLTPRRVAAPRGDGLVGAGASLEKLIG
jgi:hypothetical protein